MTDDPVKQALAAFIDERIAAALTRATKPANDEYIATDVAAKIAGVTTGTIRRWLRDKKLRRYGQSQRHRVSRDELERYLGGMKDTPEDKAKRRFG